MKKAKNKDGSVYIPTKKRIMAAPEQPRVKKTNIHSVNGFSFYLEEPTEYGIRTNPNSIPLREYYIEHNESKNRVVLPVALKFGEIGSIDIDVLMWDFIHDFDEGLD